MQINISLLYIFVLIIITLIITVYYFIKQNDYYQEIEKIKRLEIIENENKKRLERLRTHTKPCNENYKDPRSCFFNSGFTCSWNELTKRCEIKK
jgi:hypothetical protein